MGWNSVVWVPSLVRVKRTGMFGRLVDMVKPLYVDNPAPYAGRYVALNADGVIFSTSSDGVTWTKPFA